MSHAAVQHSGQQGWAILVALEIWLGLVTPGWGGDDPPPAVTSPPSAASLWPTAVILAPPADRDALLGKLRRPDLIFWDAASFDRRWLGPTGTLTSTHPATALVSRVALTVRPNGPRASLTVQLGIVVDGDGPVSVPIALDGLTLARVAEAGVNRAVSTPPDRRGWSVALVGRGEHQIEVQTSVPVRSSGADQTLELATPPAAMTAVELETNRPLDLARAGNDEPLVIDTPATPSRASGHLSPRGRLQLTWHETPSPEEVRPPVLAARGELALTVSPDALESRETWSIAALRGETNQVRFRLKASEEVLALEVDRRPAPSARRHLDGSEDDVLIVTLVEPITPARPVALVLATRRSRSASESGTTARFLFEGHPILDARSQTGLIGVARSDAIEINPEVGTAVRRVDPRTDLPDAFRGRPDAWLGYGFAAQPFALTLEVRAVTPQFEATAQSTITPGLDRVEVATTITGRVWQGRLFELRVAVPSGLVYRPAEPAADSPVIRPFVRPPGSTDPLVVRFLRPLTAGDHFTIQLRGSSRILGDGPTMIPLFQALDPTIATDEVVLVSGPNRRLDLADNDPTRFVPVVPALTPPGWTWPVGFDPNLGATATWLRAERSAGSVRVNLTSCPTKIRHRSSLTVAVDRQGADVVDEISGDVVNGSITTLDIALPPEVADRWVAEAGETLDQEALEPDPTTGWRRYRIKLGEPTDEVQVRYRYRLEFALPSPGSGQDKAAPRLRVEPIRPLAGVTTGQSIRFLSESDVELQAVAPGWIERPVEVHGPADAVQQVRRSFEHPESSIPEPVEVTATLGQLAHLPTLVASRLWLRSIELPGGALASMMQCRLETHPREVMVRLPAGSHWVRGQVGSSEIRPADVELLSPDTYRITLPAAVGSSPVAIRLDSILDQGPGDDSWPAPILLDGVVQQTVWELDLLGTRAGVGVPAGWNDENQWYQAGLLWKREPRRTEADLNRWLADGLPHQSNPEPNGDRLRSGSAAAADWSGDFTSGRHSYLFSRPGPPTLLRFTTFARATLVLLCSGPVLLVGLFLLARRPPSRLVLASLLVLTLGLGAVIEVNTVLLVAESSVVGVLLAIVAALIQGLMDRRGKGLTTAPLAMMVEAGSASALSATPLTPVEANDPTVIRPPLDRIGGSTSEFALPNSDPSAVFPPPEGDR